MRLSFYEHMIEEVKLIAKQGTCPRLKVGAVLFDRHSKRIMLKSYNGSPAGMSHCEDVGCYMINNHCKRAEHAERNLLFTAAKEGIAVKDKSILITHSPCIDCVRGLAQAGISNVFYLEPYRYNEDMIKYIQELQQKTNIRVELWK